MNHRHETTSSAFTWVLHLLAKYKDYQTILRRELRTALPTFTADMTDIDPSQSSILDSLPYLNAICAEAFRFNPSVPNTLRVAARDTSLGSVHIPSGTEFIIPAWQLNRSQDLWGPRAEEFWPERWIDFTTSKNQTTEGKFNNHGGAKTNFSLLTFLHGPRSCIGQGFAKNELKALVAAWVLAFEFELKDPSEEILAFGMVTIKPKNGLYLRLKPL
jgi:cytochrome P450